jgi:hypothetical protein
MKSNLRKWLLAAGIAGSVAFGTGSAVATEDLTDAAQTPWQAVEPAARADLREDRFQAQRLRQQIEEDRERLRGDIFRYGRGSLPVKLDRRQLRLDRQALARVLRDMSRDRRLEERREGWR